MYVGIGATFNLHTATRVLFIRNAHYVSSSVLVDGDCRPDDLDLLTLLTDGDVEVLSRYLG